MSRVRLSIALNIDGRVIDEQIAKEAIKAYGRTVYKITYREMERLHSRALQWAEEFDRQRQKLEPLECSGTIICNNAEGCEKRSCPARTVTPATWSRRMKTI